MRMGRVVSITKNQFGFTAGHSTREVIHLVRNLMELYWERNMDLHMAFIDLEKTYDKVPRGFLSRCFEARGVPLA